MSESKKIAKKGMKNIILLGLVSCFADISSEMVYPVIPLYLAAVLGTTPAIIGVIEGVAESLAALLKVASGYLGDRFERKKLLAFSGYATGVVYKIVLIFASTWAGVFTARVIDRLGKGIRTAPRDVMVAQSADKNKMGGAFGIHKMLDMAGSAVGILFAFIALKSMGTGGYKTLFALSIIPVAAALFLFVFIREKREPKRLKKQESLFKSFKSLDGRLKLYLAVTFLFTLGNSSNSFLLLRAYDVGFSGTNAILLYLVYNVTASLLAIPFGRLSDKNGRKKLLVAGYLTFSLVYFGFAFCPDKWVLCAVFVLYGVYTAMTAGVERAFISEIAPAHLKGTMLGLHSTLAGIALLPASIVAGLLWDTIGSFAPFLYGAVMSLAASIILAKGLKPPQMLGKRVL